MISVVFICFLSISLTELEMTKQKLLPRHSKEDTTPKRLKPVNKDIRSWRRLFSLGHWAPSFFFFFGCFLWTNDSGIDCELKATHTLTHYSLIYICILLVALFPFSLPSPTCRPPFSLSVCLSLSVFLSASLFLLYMTQGWRTALSTWLIAPSLPKSCK